MSLRLYKTIKALSQLLAVAAGIFFVTQGADPTFTFAVIGSILVGPEVIEAYLANIDPTNSE